MCDRVEAVCDEQHTISLTPVLNTDHITPFSILAWELVGVSTFVNTCSNNGPVVNNCLSYFLFHEFQVVYGMLTWHMHLTEPHTYLVYHTT